MTILRTLGAVHAALSAGEVVAPIGGGECFSRRGGLLSHETQNGADFVSWGMLVSILRHRQEQSDASTWAGFWLVRELPRCRSVYGY